MATTTAEKNAIAAKFGTDTPFASLHSADPGTTGANEISGGTPAYARKALTWSTAASGATTATVTFDVPTGVTVAGAGFWSAATAGTYVSGGTVASQAFSAQGTYALTVTFTYSQP